MMNAKQLRHFEKLLQNRLAELIRQADDTVRDLKQGDEERPPDPLHQAAEENHLNFFLRIRDRESILIGKIRRSLRDIGEGTCGTCVICGRDIGLKRLKARPVARHCIACKTAMESKERSYP
jgi:DnaK suppressor protein